MAEPCVTDVPPANKHPVVAAAAQMSTPTPWTWENVQQVEISMDPFSASFDEHVALTGTHPMLGLQLVGEDGGLLCLKDVAKGTALAQIKRWWSWL